MIIPGFSLPRSEYFCLRRPLLYNSPGKMQTKNKVRLFAAKEHLFTWRADNSQAGEAVKGDPTNAADETVNLRHTI
jgi:hypothetical protein